jgi:hypothetical protein
MKKTLTFISAILLGTIVIFLLSFAQYISKKAETPEVVQEEMIVEEKIDLSGTWHSNEDFSYIVIFNANGTYEDIYNGDTLERGNWSILDSLEGEEIAMQTDFFEGPYLKKSTTDIPLYYSIFSFENNQLEMFYLDRGNVLTFSRVE